MRWRSWLPRSQQRRQSVVGLDVGGEACSLVVLSGTSELPDAVCCAERLHLPDGLVAHGEVLQSTEFGLWLRTYLEANDYQADAIYMGLDSAMVSHHWVTLAAGLSDADLAFQLQTEVQALLPPDANDVRIDYSLDASPSPAGTVRYAVQAAPRLAVDALQCVAKAAGLTLMAIEPRCDAARRTQRAHALVNLPKASMALALQCDEAFGLALRAWSGGQVGVNLLPHREAAQHGLRRAWLTGMAVCTMGGTFLAAGLAMTIASAAETKHPHMDEVMASARAYDDAQLAHGQAHSAQTRLAEQVRWLGAQQVLQSQSLQWSRVLSQSAQGVWVGSVKQQGTRWVVQGEALSSQHAQQFLQQLKALDIWAQTPELPQLELMHGVSTTGLPVWQFRIEAGLKVGV